jgi:hypothetical protein
VPEGGGTHCVYRSIVPSAGFVSWCRSDRDCRVGYYHGDPATPTWLAPPPGMAALPRPEVTWHSGTLAQVRFDCGPPCTVSYFLDVKRRRLSEPRRDVLALDARRLLVAVAEGRALVIRQVFSGREVMRIERDWAPAPWLGDVVGSLHFGDDGRLSFTWLRGPGREAVSDRLSVPSFARP